MVLLEKQINRGSIDNQFQINQYFQVSINPMKKLF